MIHWSEVDLPFGRLTVIAAREAVTAIHWSHGPHSHPPSSEDARLRLDDGQHDLLCLAAGELRAFARGDTSTTNFPTRISGTRFQLAVWRAVSAIPYGSTLSYRDLALALGRPTAVRAVAAAIARNPLCIVVPCHRVIGSNGALTGYSGGLAAKRGLLALENRTGPAHGKHGRSCMRQKRSESR